ncbi:MAG: alpha-galactosidase, partial [Spirochaetaceae bacterium]|nr:alpha-galactosidase [Spirochaetaceae bacterium]
MAILYDKSHNDQSHNDKNSQTFTLHTKNTTYQFGVGKYGFLLHYYYGSRVEDQDMQYLIHSIDRGFSGNPYDAGADRAFSPDTLPLEYPAAGAGDYRLAAIGVINGDGSRALDLRYQGYEILKGKYGIEGMPALYEESGGEAETLAVTLADPVSALEVKLLYGVFPDTDSITRTVVITNRGEGDIRLTRAMSMSLDFLYGDFDLIHFHGKHAMEREFERVPVMHGIQTLSSLRGTSSHQHNPGLILCGRDTTEAQGFCFGLNLVYSGSFTAGVEKDQIGLTRVSIGPGGPDFCRLLRRGESFAAPEAVLSLSLSGFAELSHHFHRLYRHNLCRGAYKLSGRPVLINNWEATYFDFDGEKLINIAGQAVDLGLDMLVMDDGWFGSRDNDTRGLGDWFVNEAKLKTSLKNLVEEVNRLGLKFGIWFEPEMVNEDSALYREHPDWVLRIPSRNPVRSRYQLVLDMSREAVRNYLYDSICAVLDSANIEYVKWDMNRSISDWYSPLLSAGQQGELPHRYVLGLYELLGRITTRYPRILFEGCSGGGGRFDPGMLYYHPQIWCSDNTDAIERLKIQYGTSFFYPISTVGSHVSAVPNHQTGRTTPMETRGIVAMSGSFGLELDPAKMTA